MNTAKETYFGDPNTFAIRYLPDFKLVNEKSTWYYAFLHLHLNGQVIGNPQESCSVLTWLDSINLLLKRIKNNELTNVEFSNRTDYELFELIWKANQFKDEFSPAYIYLPKLDNSVWANCHLSLDETTDAYLITTTQIDNDIKIIWQGWGDPCPPDLINKLFSLSIRKDILIKTIE